jgi:Ca2+/Na+ antiporter
MIACIFAAALALWKENRTAEIADAGTKTRPAMLALGIVACVMMVRVTNIFWTLLPKLKFVQFPWRLMMVLAVIFAFFVATAARRALVLAWIVLLLALSLTGTYLVKRTWWDTEDVNTVKEAVDTKAGFEGTDEYDPLGDDHTDVPQKQLEAKVLAEKGEPESGHTPELRIVRWTSEERIVVVQSKEPARIRLRLLHYPAWLVSIDGKAAHTLRTVSYDSIVVVVPSGESRIEARFTRTMDRTIGGCISLVSGVAAALLAWPLKRRQA